MDCDETDIKILQALMNDGRASLTQVADRTSLTTPTVSSRLARMMKSGVIRKFVPILSTDSAERGITALVTLRVKSSSSQKLARRFAKLAQVESVYTTTGQGIVLKIGLETAQELEPFLTENLSRREIQVTSSQIVTGTLKEEPSSLIPKTLSMNLRCDYCGGPVTGRRPNTLTFVHSRYYFCCRTCRKGYLDEHALKTNPSRSGRH